MSESTKHLNAGDRVAARDLTTISGTRVTLPDRDSLVHLQFRRFAGCPVCDLHLRSIARRYDEISAAGVREVVVFHSSVTELRQFAAHELPFPVVADPNKRLYAEFGVESAPRALLNPRAWWPILRAVTASVWLISRGKAPVRMPSTDGGKLGLPADFLVGRDGRVLACHYGEHVNDQWSADDILERSTEAAAQTKRSFAESAFRTER